MDPRIPPAIALTAKQMLRSLPVGFKVVYVFLLFITIVALPVGILFLVFGLDGPRPDVGWSFGLGGVGVGLLCFIIAVVIARWQVKRLARQQLLYYQWAGVPEPTTEELAALQLDAFAVYYNGWAETLERYPAPWRVAHIKNATRKLSYLPMADIDHERKAFDEWWGMLSTEDYHRLVEDLWNGGHTEQFLVTALADRTGEFRRRMSNLTGIDAGYVDACLEGVGTRPPRLIWAWDLWRIVLLSRTAFLLQLIDEKEAWTQIHRVSEVVHTLFESLDDYHQNLRLGHAMWSNKLETVQNRQAEIDRFMHATPRWPILDVPWRRAEAKLPDRIASGIGDVRVEVEEFLRREAEAVDSDEPDEGRDLPVGGYL